ncbi:MAG TPA: hypothetical protein VGM90_06200 [Kofleriaceae bacterium]
MIRKLAGLAVDARYAISPSSCSVERAIIAQWVAKNALAATGVPACVGTTEPTQPGVLYMQANSLTALLSAIASVPVLVDAAHLPARWRLALRLLGVPALDRPAKVAIAEGASVLTVQHMLAA